jgi:hypothetical protein
MTPHQTSLQHERQIDPWSIDASGGLWSDWLALTDTRHLVATSRNQDQQGDFAARLHQTAATIPDAQVLMIHGGAITSADDLLMQLRLQLPGALSREPSAVSEASGSVRDAGDLDREQHALVLGKITDVLRSRVVPEGWRGPRFRYFFWHQADALLNRNPELFGELVDLALGVAAECDYGHSDHLMIQRWVFLGSRALDVYAEDGRGQFCSWLADSPGVRPPSPDQDGDDHARDRGRSCFIDWSAATGCLFPQVRRVNIDDLMNTMHAG